MTIRLHNRAQDDLRDAAEFFERQRPGLGEDFRAEVQAALDRIVAFPEGCHIVDDAFRQCRIQRFPYGVVYRIKDEQIEVMAITHLRRDPGHWRNRV